MIFEVGMNAEQLLSEIISSNQNIDELTLAIYRPSMNFTERVVQRLSVETISEKSRESFVENQKISLDECLDHDLIEEYERRRTVGAKTFSEDLQRLKSDLKDDQVLAACSICKTASGDEVHIPMMDFACDISVGNLELIKFLLGKMGLAGAILESGKSYHYYGFDVVSGEEWLSMMARFILAAPLTDVRYIAHRILGRTAVLRMTSTAKKPQVPFVKAIV